MTTGLRYLNARSNASIVRSSISCGVDGVRTIAWVLPWPSPRQASLMSDCSGAMLPRPGPPRITLTKTPGTSAPNGTGGDRVIGACLAVLLKGNGFGAVLVAEPVSEVNDQAREESCFSHPEEKANPVKLIGRLDETRSSRENSPRDHNARNPLPGAPALDDDRSRNFKQHISCEEDSNSEPIDTITEAQVDAHPQIRKRHVDPVDIAHRIHDEQERKQSHGYAAAGTLRDIGG